MVARFLTLAALLAVYASSHAQEAATHALTPAAAEKFVRGADIHDIPQLSVASERAQLRPAAWTGIRENAQRSPLE